MKAIKIIPNWTDGDGPDFWQRLDFHVVLALTMSLFVQTITDDLTLRSIFYTFCLGFANDIALTIGHVYIFHYLDKHCDWLTYTKKRFWLGALLHSGYSAIAFLIVQLILFGLFFDMSISEIFSWYLEQWWLPIGVTAAVIVFTTTTGFFQNWKNALVEEEKVRAEMMAYKFDSLKNQINPNFIFESLEGLKHLMDDDPKEAVSMIQKMSHLYRSVLETKDMELVPLEQEMANAIQFLSLQKIRIGGEIELKSSLAAGSKERMVPSAIQNTLELLMECLGNQDQPSVVIGRKEDCLSVSAIREQSDAEVISNSLNNLKQRYAFFTDRTIDISKQDSELLISIPILQEE